MSQLKVSGVFRLGRDPELKTLDSGSVVANFSVAADNKYVKGEDKLPPVWVGVDVWGKRAEFVTEYFKKGSLIELTGKLSTREWEGKTYLDLEASTVDFVPGSKAAEVEAGSLLGVGKVGIENVMAPVPGGGLDTNESSPF